ncbi:glycosyltransferase family 4 protein [Rhodoferax sp. U2-2l]|uniref:glycosyltransferase family 4 protein n=1 Tax=Rhodoferax sp. U2-2l TaxID=2884000 RepID=UPI001D0A5618|nr:glycosyltransferase family 4 protein [Rhodoferax sp. U2-2l]MCB8747868.1 glycosyltransferase family 4 protein [Rhodoferax sp. U2-2l]
MPFSSNGYAVRTHGVASALVKAGLDVIAATRPGAPWDQPGFQGQDFACSHVIDGVRYVHTPKPSEKDGPLAQYMARAVEVFKELMRVFKPTVVMAASNWRNALPAAIAARELGMPFFYEVRGFWELSHAARDAVWAQSPQFHREVAHETAVALSAQTVFTINRFMRDELVRRGVDQARVQLVPNGFAGWPTPLETKALGRVDLGIKARYVVGYIGSFNGYEGLEDLIEAVALLRGRGLDVALLLVGSSESRGLGAGVGMACPATLAYRNLAQRLGIGDVVFTPGRVAPDLADQYYALLDVVVIPRRPLAVCEIVSPLKPLEAAAHGKRVLMSDVGPLADLAALCPNFSYFKKGDMKSLAEELAKVLAGCDAPLARCSALDALTWDMNVAPMVSAVRSLELTPRLAL